MKKLIRKRTVLVMIAFILLMPVAACTPQSVEPASPGQGPEQPASEPAGADKVELVGQVEVIASDSWIVNGKQIIVADQTDIKTGIKTGDTVKVVGQLGQEGLIVARQISVFVASSDDNMNGNDANDNDDSDVNENQGEDVNENGDDDANDNGNENDDDVNENGDDDVNSNGDDDANDNSDDDENDNNDDDENDNDDANDNGGDDENDNDDDDDDDDDDDGNNNDNLNDNGGDDGEGD